MKQELTSFRTFVLYKKKIVTVHSMWYGKVATILFFIAIVLSLLSKGIPSLSVITIYAFYIAIGMTLFAGIMYVLTGSIAFTAVDIPFWSLPAATRGWNPTRAEAGT